MLPDFPNIKKDIYKKLIAPYMKVMKSNYLGAMSQIPERKIHEGSNSLMVRSDGTEETMKPKEMSGEFSYNNSDVKDMIPEDVFRKIDGAIKQMCTEISNDIIGKIETACEETGNVVSANKERFSVEHYFKLLEKIEINFDDNNNPVLPDVLIGDPTIVAEELKKIGEDKTLRKRLENIINRKREEYNARESNRELVG